MLYPKKLSSRKSNLLIKILLGVSLLIAIILTIIVVIIIGIILWFIPFTNGWMRELLFENPLFNWIGSIFS